MGVRRGVQSEPKGEPLMMDLKGGGLGVCGFCRCVRFIRFTMPILFLLPAITPVV